MQQLINDQQFLKAKQIRRVELQRIFTTARHKFQSQSFEFGFQTSPTLFNFFQLTKLLAYSMDQKQLSSCLQTFVLGLNRQSQLPIEYALSLMTQSYKRMRYSPKNVLNFVTGIYKVCQLSQNFQKLGDSFLQSLKLLGFVLMQILQIKQSCHLIQMICVLFQRVQQESFFQFNQYFSKNYLNRLNHNCPPRLVPLILKADYSILQNFPMLLHFSQSNHTAVFLCQKLHHVMYKEIVKIGEISLSVIKSIIRLARSLIKNPQPLVRLQGLKVLNLTELTAQGRNIRKRFLIEIKQYLSRQEMLFLLSQSEQLMQIQF